METEKIFGQDAPPAVWAMSKWVEHDPAAAKFKKGAMVTVKSGRIYKILAVCTHCEYKGHNRQSLGFYKLPYVHYLAVQFRNGREYQGAKYLQEKNLKASN